MKRRIWLAGGLLALLCGSPAKADTGVIIRTTAGLLPLQAFCSLPISPCTVVGALDGTLGQVFLVTTPLPFATFQGLLGGLKGFVNAEVDQVLNLVGPNLVPALIPSGLLSDRMQVLLPNSGSTVMVWNSYVNQPASTIVNVQSAQNAFHVAGTGIVADIDTGVDPGHPALQGVLLQGYDFTRNLAGASELNDLSAADLASISAKPSPCPPSTCPSPAQVNQSSAAILDQSSAAILDTNTQYAAFGHGTMVMGVIHLVAPTAKLLPLKAFKSDGTGLLSDILRAIYYAVQNSANVINMSFDFKTPSQELTNALAYAGQLTVISAASAGNNGQGPPNLVYPAALQSDVMGVASVGSTTLTMNTRSSFSNYGNGIVWVAAPGEAIITTYPFSTYSAGWGTSFSAPFVSGGAALLRGLKTTIDETAAANAIAVANALDPALGLNHGRLDLLKALGALPLESGTPDFSVSAAPSSATIAAGNPANFTVTAAPANNFSGTVTWSCMGAPATTACTVSPSSVMLNGSSTASATVTLSTMARVSSPPLALPRYAPPMRGWETWEALLAWLAVLLIICSSRRASRQRPGLATTAIVLAVSLCTYSCGGYGPPPGAGGPTLSSVALNPTSVNGGTSSAGTVTLSAAAPSGGAVVYLSSSATAATVPANVTVAAGASSATFTVSTTSVTASTSVTISASYIGVTKTASLTVVTQALPALSSVTLNPTSVTGGVQSSTGTVALSGPALTGGAQVLLTSDNGAARVPSSVTVLAGASSAIFTVSTSTVTTPTPVTISASHAGVTKTASLTLVTQALPALASVTLNPTSVTGGVQSSSGTVTLSGPALTGGAQVLLTSNNGAANVPSSVMVLAGATGATFTVSTSAVTVSTPVTISASYAGATKTASLTVAPPGTPAGTYTLTITGTSDTLSHATTVQVIVN